MMTPIKLTLMSDGHCRQLERIALRGGRWRLVKFEALFALLEHPSGGPVLFDTGYSPRFFTETRRWPARAYRWLTPVTLPAQPGSAAVRLAARGIPPEKVGHIFLSHFHADHMGGLRDFPAARVHCSRAAWEDVAGRRGFSALRRAYLPGLLPDDFAARVRFLEDRPAVELPNELKPFGGGHDVLGDGSLLTVPLPGHAKGQTGLFFHDSDGTPTLLAADGAWSGEAIRSLRPPSWIARGLGDRKTLRETLRRLHELHRAHPGVRIIPSHCPEIPLS